MNAEEVLREIVIGPFRCPECKEKLRAGYMPAYDGDGLEESFNCSTCKKSYRAFSKQVPDYLLKKSRDIFAH